MIYSMGMGLSLRELLVVVGGCFRGIERGWWAS